MAESRKGGKEKGTGDAKSGMWEGRGSPGRKKRGKGDGGDKSPAWSSQDLGSTAIKTNRTELGSDESIEISHVKITRRIFGSPVEYNNTRVHVLPPEANRSAPTWIQHDSFMIISARYSGSY